MLQYLVLRWWAKPPWQTRRCIRPSVEEINIVWIKSIRHTILIKEIESEQKKASNRDDIIPIFAWIIEEKFHMCAVCSCEGNAKDVMPYTHMLFVQTIYERTCGTSFFGEYGATIRQVNHSFSNGSYGYSTHPVSLMKSQKGWITSCSSIPNFS